MSTAYWPPAYLRIFLLLLALGSAVRGQASISNLVQNAKTIEDLRYVLGSNYRYLVAAYWRYMLASCELVGNRMDLDYQAQYLQKFCAFVNPCPEVYVTQSCLVQVTAIYIYAACCPVRPTEPPTTTPELTTADSRMFPPSAPSCMYGAVTPSAKIYGGMEAKKGEFPWVAMLLKDGSFLCGGTIIDNSHVVTAAHCFDSITNNSQYEVFAGRYTFDLNIQENEAQRVPVKSIKVHEQYDYQIASNDLAMVTLLSPLKITSYVTPACLPSINDSLEPFCTVAGWGETYGGVPPNVLMKVRLQTYNVTECIKTFNKADKALKAQISNDFICAANGTYGGKDSCKGDSGGPLMCAKLASDGTYRYFVFGLVSNGNGCALPEEPGVYTKVVNYLDWIEAKINES